MRVRLLILLVSTMILMSCAFLFTNYPKQSEGDAFIEVTAPTPIISITQTITPTPTLSNPQSIQIEMDRVSLQKSFIVKIKVLDANKNILSTSLVSINVTGGTSTTLVQQVDGSYQSLITPTSNNRIVNIVANSGVLTKSKTALVFDAVDENWNQAEMLEGSVNTLGWEDSPSISPDGEWLFVHYSPIDFLSCLTNNITSNPACSTAIGPYSGSERPTFIGANRIANDGHITQNCPSLNWPPGGGELTIPVPPASTYGFHKSIDGSYIEPFEIGFSGEGCIQYYGLSFAGAVTSNTASVVFTLDDLSFTTGFDFYMFTISLGQKTVLGGYDQTAGKVLVSNNPMVQKLPLPVLTGRQGNVNFAGQRLWWDNEDETSVNRDLYYADVTGNLPNATISTTKKVGLSQAGVEEYQPTFDIDTIYFTDSGGYPKISMSTLTANSDPSLNTSWSQRKPLIGISNGSSFTGALLAVGEPTIAHFEGTTWLYFVYLYKTATGYDANVGRIPKRIVK